MQCALIVHFLQVKCSCRFFAICSAQSSLIFYNRVKEHWKGRTTKLDRSECKVAAKVKHRRLSRNIWRANIKETKETTKTFRERGCRLKERIQKEYKPWECGCRLKERRQRKQRRPFGNVGNKM